MMDYLRPRLREVSTWAGVAAALAIFAGLWLAFRTAWHVLIVPALSGLALHVRDATIADAWDGLRSWWLRRSPEAVLTLPRPRWTPPGPSSAPSPLAAPAAPTPGNAPAQSKEPVMPAPSWLSKAVSLAETAAVDAFEAEVSNASSGLGADEVKLVKAAVAAYKAQTFAALTEVVTDALQVAGDLEAQPAA